MRNTGLRRNTDLASVKSERGKSGKNAPWFDHRNNVGGESAGHPKSLVTRHSESSRRESTGGGLEKKNIWGGRAKVFTDASKDQRGIESQRDESGLQETE